MDKKIWNKMLIALLLTLAVLALVVFRFANPAVILAEIRELSDLLLGLAFASMALSWVVDALRLRTLTLAVRARPPILLFIATLIAANFLTLITPFAAGGAPLVIYTLVRIGLTVGEATAVVVGGGIAAQFALFFLVNMALFFVRNYAVQSLELFSYIQGIAIVYGVVLVLLIFAGLHSAKLQNWLDRALIKYTRPLVGKILSFIQQLLQDFQGTFQVLFSPKGILYFGGAFLGGFAYYSVQYGSLFFLLSGFGVAEGAPLARFGYGVLLGVAPILMPLPGGTGAAEYLAYHIFNNTMPTEELATLIVLWRVVMFYFPIVAGGISFFALTVSWAKRK